ncbi:ribosome maturation factor RimM [Isoptericola sp. b441]|uniref:Ribosome maturation factor RimM n=1 Tax=Actinotalea lenta TaxID=3064654 RepID=A0ABT9D8V0_9CELL|nr:MULTISPECIES: ribosome maturation factor RimM [unclassified Isoptericola]MDO8107328.1 ribosome maturation factor RimM [Isoptericola sp. b441]MDO8121009.1 ribosome maturation factor RimM [Isoptericola sp. b490]
MQLAVATVGRAHGLRGEVAVDVRTDQPEARFTAGRTLSSERGALVVSGARRQGERWYLTFEGVTDRTAAESLRGTELRVEVDEDEEPDAWYPHELAGLRAELADGTVVGAVVGLEHLPAQDALVVREPDGTRSLVPFVTAIVPVVDVPGGRVVLDPPAGLLAAVGEADVDLPED